MTLADFFATLDGLRKEVPLATLLGLLRRLELRRTDIMPFLHFSEEGCRRNLLRDGNGYEAHVVCWKSGQKTPIHDHRGSACGVLVLDGEVIQQSFSRDGQGHLQPGACIRLEAGAVCGACDTDIHQLVNPAAGELVTLHVHSPPLRATGVYERNSTKVTEQPFSIRS